MLRVKEKSLAFIKALHHLCVGAVVIFALLLLASSAHAQSVKLERGWQLLLDKDGTLAATEINNAKGWRDVRVGLSWNAQFADLRDYMGAAWYRTKFNVPQLNNESVLVHFGAVDYFSRVYVNGKWVGEHEGGYTPFSLDVTKFVKTGVNELVVRVVDPPMDEKQNRALFPEMMYNEIPHGKQNWYVQTGGIWQPVTLDIRPSLYIKRVQVSANRDGNFNVRVNLLGLPVHQRSPIDVTIRDASGKIAFSTHDDGSINVANRYFEGQLETPQLWSPQHPTLYSVEVKLNGGEDTVTERFGFRSFETRDGKFYLNGKPFYLIGALDQDFYPETIYTPPSEEFVRDEMLKAKRLGLNMLRCHIKVPDPMYLKVADETGMLVWYEIPSWNDFHHFTKRAAERGEQTFREQVERDWNHPSIVIQSIINESWGVDLKEDEQRKWLRSAVENARIVTLPLRRLIVDNSACCDGFHIKSDIDDFHQYFSIPDQYQDWDKWVADFATRPRWSYSQHGDAERSGKEPLVVSEFGNWGLPVLPKTLPWWFERDFAGREVTRPAGLFDRFKEFQLARIFRDYDELARESQWHQFISLKHEIEEMRQYASIQGYVITEFTDINWEVNGLMDMWRNPKIYTTELAKIQQPDVVLARLSKRNFVSGERVDVRTLISHYSDAELEGATVSWSTDSGASGKFKINRSLERASVAELEPISFVAPAVTKPRLEKLTIIVSNAAGAVIAENSFEIFVFPKDTTRRGPALSFYDPTNSRTGLMKALTAAGYQVSPFKTGSVDDKSLLVASVIDDAVKGFLRNGGCALILADSKEAFPSGSAYKVTPRAGSDLDGNWVTNFNWVKTDAAPFSEVAFTKILGFESDMTVPRYIIQGIPAAHYDDVLSGIFYGWLNNNAALAVEMRTVGGGRLFITTFRFDAYGSDPYATRLLDAMIRYTSSLGFAPKLDYPL